MLAYLGFADYLGVSDILWQQPLNYYLVPIIVSSELSFIHVWLRTLFKQILTVTAFLVASGFMTVYHMAVDTVFICACKSGSFITHTHHDTHTHRDTHTHTHTHTHVHAHTHTPHTLIHPPHTHTHPHTHSGRPGAK